MLSLLVLSEAPEKSRDFAKNFCKTKGISDFDIAILEYQESIGIEEIREMQKKLYLKPFKGKTKGVIIVNAHTATKEAQNALLKVLEEPPINTQLILTATTTQHFLPTVLSRCKIIDLDETKETLSKDDEEKYQDEFGEILMAGVAQRLKIAQEKSAEKQQMQAWLIDMIFSLRKQMIITNSYKLVTAISAFQEAVNKLQTTNINPRFLCENLLLNLPNMK